MKLLAAVLKLPSWASKAILGVLIALAALSAAQGCRTALETDGSIDLGMPLKAAQLLQSQNPYSTILAGVTIPELSASQDNPFPMMPMQVPSVLMLFWPLTLLPWSTAKLAWLFANLGFTAGSLYLAIKRFVPSQTTRCYVLIASLLLISFPWRVAIGNGQHILAAMFFFLLSMELADRGRKIWAGIALALSFIKYSSALFLLPYFVWKREWQPVLVAFALHGAMTLGIALWLGENPLKLVAQALSAGSSVLASKGYLDVYAMANSLQLPRPLATATTLLVTAATLWIAYHRRSDERRFVVLLCMWSLIAIYHRLYDFVILLIPLLISLQMLRREWVLPVLILGAMAFPWFVDRPVLEFTAWRRNSPYFWFVAVVFYFSFFLLLYRQLRPRSPGEPERLSL